MRLFSFLAVLPISLAPIADRPFTSERIPEPSSVREATGYETHSAVYFRSLLQQRPESGNAARERERERPRSDAEPSRKPNRDPEGGVKPNKGLDDELPSTPISTTPEPATVILLGTGVAALFVGRRFIRRKRAG
jgi:hypothetical protein